MAYRPTRYEITLKNRETGETFLFCYVNARSRDALARCLRQAGPEIIEFCGADRFYTKMRAQDGVMVGDWDIQYTGRTQLQAKQEGEKLHPFWLDALRARRQETAQPQEAAAC